MNALVRAVVFGGPVILLAAAIAFAQLTEATPPVDDDMVLLVSSLLLGIVLQVFIVVFERKARTQTLELAARGSLVVFLASAVGYGLVLFNFSVRRDDDHNVRAPLGIFYTADFRDYVTEHPDATGPAWVAGGDSPELVYTTASLQAIKLLFAALWLTVTPSLTLFLACTGFLLYRREVWLHPLLVILRERIEQWPEGDARELRSALRAAMKTLVDHGNKHGAVLTVAPLFEGQGGYLGAVALASGTKLERSLWADQIEELRTAGHLPPHIASELHSIRICSNDARHNKRRLTFDDARRALEAAVCCEEWYLYEFPRGPLHPRPDASRSQPSPPRTA